MASVFQTNEISQQGLLLIAQATAANPIVFVDSRSASQVPQDPELENFYNGINGTIDASSATDATARVVALFGNTSTSSPQVVKAIAIRARLASQSDSQAVIFAYSYDNDSAIYFPSNTAPAQRTRFAFAFDFSQTQSVSVTEAGSASLADLERLVSCHKAGNPNAGEDQTILGDKTWEDQQDFNEACRFHDTVSTHNVYPDGANFNVGSAQAEYNHVYAKYGTFSTSLQAASALVQSTLIANRVNARSELDIKGITIIGKTRLESDYYTYELQVHGGDKYETPQTGVCGRLDILPTITVIDPSSGDATDYTAEINMGNAAHRLSEIYAMRVNQKSLVLQPVDGTLDDATMFYAEKVPEPGDESGRYYEYAIYIKTPETPLGEAWNYAIVPDQNWVDLGYASKPFYSLYLESGIVLGSTTNNDGGIRLRAERTNAETQGHYDLNLNVWMACGANTHTWDNFNITPWTGSIAQNINLGTENRPFNNIDIKGNVRCVNEQTGQYMTGTLGDISHFWWNTFSAYVTVKNVLSAYEITSALDPTTATSSNKASVSDLTAGEMDTGNFLLLSKVGGRSTKYHVDNLQLSRKSESAPFSAPIGGLVMAVASEDWLRAHPNTTIYPGRDITVSNSQPWYMLRADCDPNTGEVDWNSDVKRALPAGTYHALVEFSVLMAEQGRDVVDMTTPIMLQRIS